MWANITEDIVCLNKNLLPSLTICSPFELKQAVWWQRRALNNQSQSDSRGQGWGERLVDDTMGIWKTMIGAVQALLYLGWLNE